MTEWTGQTLIGSVQRALRLVDIVAASPRPVPAKQLASETGLTLGTTYNLVRTLVHEGFLSAEQDGLVLGARYPGVAAVTDGQGVPLAQVRQGLHDVSDAFGGIACFARYEEGEVQIVDIVRAADEAVRGPGAEPFAHATAFGKRILADIGEEDRGEFLSRHPLVACTPHTITDTGVLLSELAQTGVYASEREERVLGMRGIAVSMQAPGMTGAIGVAIPVDAPLADEKAASRILRRVARRLSIQLGLDGRQGAHLSI